MLNILKIYRKFKKNKNNNVIKEKHIPFEIYIEITKHMDIKTSIIFHDVKKEIYNYINNKVIQSIKVELKYLKDIEKYTNIVYLKEFIDITNISFNELLLKFKSKNELDKYINLFKYFDINIYHFSNKLDDGDQYDKFEYHLEEVKQNLFNEDEIEDNFIFEVQKVNIFKHNKLECSNFHELKLSVNIISGKIKLYITNCIGNGHTQSIDFLSIFDIYNDKITKINDIIYIFNWYKEIICDKYFHDIYNIKINESLSVDNKIKFKKIENKPFDFYDNEFNKKLINITKYDLKSRNFIN